MSSRPPADRPRWLVFGMGNAALVLLVVWLLGGDVNWGHWVALAGMYYLGRSNQWWTTELWGEKRD